MRIMLDSNVHDLIVADEAVRQAILRRIEDGHLKLISTHVQRDELSLAPQPKRASLMAIYGLAESVATTGAMFDVSRWDECAWGSDQVHASMVALMAGNSNHAEDALIAATAADQADVLVKNDVRLDSKIQSTGFSVEVWSWSKFVDWVTCLQPAEE